MNELDFVDRTGVRGTDHDVALLRKLIANVD